MKEGLKRVIKFLEVKEEGNSGKVTTLLNSDIIPLPPHRRTWNTWTYLGFWNTDNFIVSAWAAASSLISIGLSVNHTMGLIVVSNALVAAASIANAWPGAKYHVGYTICQRMIFGIYGSALGIIIRIILSIVWFGSQAWMGGLAVSVLLSTWSRSYWEMKNTFPENVYMTSRELCGFVVFQVISILVLRIRPERIHTPVIISNCYNFFVMLGIGIWAWSHTHGDLGPLMHQSSLHGSSALGWAWVYGITSKFGSIVSGISNQSDYTRFSVTTYSPIVGSIVGICVVGQIIPLIGLLATSALSGKYGVLYWNPLNILFLWMENDDYSARSRAAAFFASLGFVCAQLAMNTLGNAYAGGMDLSGLFPKFINIKRGAVITALLSWVVQPWRFYNSASVFVTVMGSFSVFLSPLIGIIICDFYFIRNRRIMLKDLYTDDPNGAYYFTGGINWRAVVVWFGTFAIALPGMIHNINKTIPLSSGIYDYFKGNCFFGLFIAMAWYYITCRIFPIKRAGEQDDEDVFGTFTRQHALHLGFVPHEDIDKNSEPEYVKEEILIGELEAKEDGPITESKELAMAYE